MKVFYEPVTIKLENEREVIELVNSQYSKSFIATTVQYKNLLKKLKNKNKGIVLGCNTRVVEGFKGEIVLFIGDGVFHPLMIKKNNPFLKIFTLNPFNMKIEEVKESSVKKFRVRELMAKKALKEAGKVGIILSVKKGQFLLEDGLELKKELEEQDKKVYLFLFDTINYDEFLNFPGLDCLVNTACPRIGLDDYSKFPVPVINYTNI